MPKKILVVDDEQDIILFVKTLLEKEGYIVETLFNGYDALEKLEKERFDLLILDIFMPQINGWEVLSRIREDKKLDYLPVIVYSVIDEMYAYEKVKNLDAILVSKQTIGEKKFIDEIKNMLSGKNV